MAGNGELVVTWETEAQLNARAARKDAARTAQRAAEIQARWRSEDPQPQAPSADEMITALDAAADLSDGIDPRTWREVYDAGLVDAEDVRRAYGSLLAGALGMPSQADPEPYLIDGIPACGAPVDGGRCGRRPHHGDGHPHIKEPGTEVRGEYYVIVHGFRAPASRPAARFGYAGLEAGDAFDRALRWARESVTERTSFDLYHADTAGQTFIVQVTTDRQLTWPRH